MKEQIMEKFEKEKTKEKATKEKATKENNPSWLLLFVPVFIKQLNFVMILSLYRNMVAVAFYYSAARVKRL